MGYIGIFLYYTQSHIFYLLKGDYSSERISTLNIPDFFKKGTTFMRTLSESLLPLDLYRDFVQQI